MAGMNPEITARTVDLKTRRPELALMRSKFSRPPNRPAFVEVARLLYRLDEAFAQRQVTLASAPPGFGKTTLATQWSAGQGVAAIEDGTPHRLPKTTAVLPAPAPAAWALCDLLVSELAEIKARHPHDRRPSQRRAESPQPDGALRGELPPWEADLPVDPKFLKSVRNGVCPH